MSRPDWCFYCMICFAVCKFIDIFTFGFSYYINMSIEQKNKIEYIVACISEFARRHGLTIRQSYNYLSFHKGLRFLSECYDVEHTFSMDDAVDDLTAVCQKNGGLLI